LVNGGVAKTKLATSVQTSLDKADTALQASDIAGLVNDQHTHSNKALLDTYAQTEANLADAVSKKHSHDNKAVIDGITAAKVSAWDSAEQNAKNYADGLAGNYATAAQGAKADTAIQDIVLGVDGEGPEQGVGGIVAFTLVFDEGEISNKDNPIGSSGSENAGTFGVIGDADINVTPMTDESAPNTIVGALSLAPATKAKIEGAVQEITYNCTANPAQETSGLKVTRAENSNSVNIEIDDSVTFIFDCGSAIKNI
jgi:hypothetical protein